LRQPLIDSERDKAKDRVAFDEENHRCARFHASTEKVPKVLGGRKRLRAQRDLVILKV